jgi:hypothetical protein
LQNSLGNLEIAKGGAVTRPQGRHQAYGIRHFDHARGLAAAQDCLWRHTVALAQRPVVIAELNAAYFEFVSAPTLAR